MFRLRDPTWFEALPILGLVQIITISLSWQDVQCGLLEKPSLVNVLAKTIAENGLYWLQEAPVHILAQLRTSSWMSLDNLWGI